MPCDGAIGLAEGKGGACKSLCLIFTHRIRERPDHPYKILINNHNQTAIKQGDMISNVERILSEFRDRGEMKGSLEVGPRLQFQKQVSLLIVLQFST